MKTRYEILWGCLKDMNLLFTFGKWVPVPMVKRVDYNSRKDVVSAKCPFCGSAGDECISNMMEI